MIKVQERLTRTHVSQEPPLHIVVVDEGNEAFEVVKRICESRQAWDVPKQFKSWMLYSLIICSIASYCIMLCFLLYII